MPVKATLSHFIRRYRRGQLLGPLLIFALGMTATLLAWSNQVKSVKSRERAALDRAALEVEHSLRDRMNAYESALWAARAHIELDSSALNQESWRQYVYGLEISHRYLGMKGLGFIRSQENSYNIELIEPRETNTYASGANIKTEPLQKQAAELARSTGQSVITGRIKLRHGAAQTSGFMLFLPVTRASPKVNTEFLGWLYAPFNLNDIFDAFSEHHSSIALKIFDRTQLDGDGLIFEQKSTRPADYALTRTVSFGQRTWTLQWSMPSEFIPFVSIGSTNFLFWAGACFSILLFFFSRNLLTLSERSKELAEQMTEKLRESEAQTKLLLDSAAESIFGVDLAGNFIFANTACVRSLGYATVQEVIGRNVHDTTHHSNQDGSPYAAHDCQIMKSFKESRQVHVETEVFWRPDQTNFPVEYWAYPLMRNGRAEGAVVTFWDITERKRTEKLLEVQTAKLMHSSKMSALGEMSAGVAHEINNPLSIISGRASQLREQAMTGIFSKEDIIKATAKIESTVWRITKIVKSLRAFSRDDSSEPMQNCKLTTLLDEVLSFTGERFKHNNIEIKIECPTDLDLDCRPVQIQQVLLNLLQNAYDATEALEKRWISVSARKIEEKIEISVTDSGPGIPEHLREKILQPFFTTKVVGKGTGLGLSVSKGFVDAHNGSISIDELSANTRFVIVLPRRQPQAGQFKVAG